MNEEYRDPVQELEDQMRAADALIESLEGEVTELRRDLERASEALRAAQEEVSARGRALEELDESERARAAIAEGARALKAELGELRRQNADEQLRLQNRHSVDMETLRQELEKQRRADDSAATGTEAKIAALREEFRKERSALEERHKAEVEDLKKAAEQWEDQLRDGYQELEERRKTEIQDLHRDHDETLEALEVEHRRELEAVRREAEREKSDLERTLVEELGRKHAEELQTLSSAAASRELDLERQLDSEVEIRRIEAEEHQAEAERLGLELEHTQVAAEERRKEDLKEVKRLAEARERELRRAQAVRLTEEKEAAERRFAALKAQRVADSNSSRERHTGELANVRRELEDRLAAEEERRRSQVAALEEQLEGLRARRGSESRLYGERLRELERGKVAEKKAAEEELEKRLEEEEVEKERLESRIAELEDALEESGTLEAELREALGDIRVRGEDQRRDDEEAHRVIDGLERRLEEANAARLSAEERASELEARLTEIVEENRRSVRDLLRAQESLKKVSDPEQRLRDGISLFNASEHTRTVASISKSLGLPKVHVGHDTGPGSPPKPVITFVWSDIAWRRYVSDPTEGVEDPRVYLIGAGDDPHDVHHRSGLEPNARMDARGHLILGIQAY